MKELMAKFKKEREFRQEPHTLPSHTSNQLSRKGTGKVLILDSRASSRLLNSSSRVTPLSALTNETRLPQRKLVFPGDPCPRLRQSGKQRKRMTSCSLASSADDKTPIISRKTRSRVRVYVCACLRGALCNVADSAGWRGRYRCDVLKA